MWGSQKPSALQRASLCAETSHCYATQTTFELLMVHGVSSLADQPQVFLQVRKLGDGELRVLPLSVPLDDFIDLLVEHVREDRLPSRGAMRRELRANLCADIDDGVRRVQPVQANDSAWRGHG